MAIMMTTDISSFIQDVYEGALFTLREMNALARTVTVFNDLNGMNPRKISEYGTLSVKTVSEGEAVVPANLSRTLLQTLTPIVKAEAVLITDERLTTDTENVRNDTVMEMGMAFSTDLDTSLSSLFSSLTGGTVGAYGGTVTWSNILASALILRQKNVPPPYFCVLGAGQYYHLANHGGTISTSFTRSDSFNTNLARGGAYYVSNPLLAGVTFVITNNISGAAGTAGLGAMYAPQAIAYDQRTPLTFEPKRDPNRRSWEINAHMRYAIGVWRPIMGVQIRATDVIPTT